MVENKEILEKIDSEKNIHSEKIQKQGKIKQIVGKKWKKIQ